MQADDFCGCKQMIFADEKKMFFSKAKDEEDVKKKEKKKKSDPYMQKEELRIKRVIFRTRVRACTCFTIAFDRVCT
jgi:hypothetical protein